MKTSLLLFLALLASSVMASPEQRLAELDLTLPAPAPAVANYVPAVRSGALLFLAGHIPRNAAGDVVTGRVGDSLGEEEAREAARLTTLALLATLRQELGSLDRVRRIVRVGGFVQATPEFQRHPAVLNGCSDLLVAVFGEQGRHVRIAVGAASLPLNAAVEIEMVVEVE